MIHGPAAVSNSRYDRPNVSPVKKPRLAASQMQWWCIAWPGVCEEAQRPAGELDRHAVAASSTIRSASTGTSVPYERSISSAP